MYVSLPDESLDGCNSSRKDNWKFRFFFDEGVDEAATDADEAVRCDEWVVRKESRIFRLCLSSSVGSVDMSVEKRVKFDVKRFSLHCSKNGLFGVDDFCRRHTPVDFGVMGNASRRWASLSIRFPSVDDLFYKDDAFHLHVPQLDLVDNVEPFSVASTRFDGSCSDIYSTQTLIGTDAIWDMSLWPLIFRQI